MAPDGTTEATEATARTAPPVPVLDALRHRLAFEDLLTRVASSFIERPAVAIDAAIDDALAEIGAFASVDRAYVAIIDDDRAVVVPAHVWRAEPVDEAPTRPVRDDPGDEPPPRLTVDDVPRWLEVLRELEPVYLPSVERLEEAWSSERALLSLAGVRSALAAPLVREGHLAGFVGFDSMTATRVWSDDQLSLLTTAAGLISQALARVDAERRFEVAFTHAPLGMALISATGRHVQVNAAYAELVGRPADELVDRPALDLVTPVDRDVVLDAVAPLLTGASVRVHVECRGEGLVDGDGDGGDRWFGVHASAVRGSDGRLRHLVVHLEDVTERRRRELDLRRSEAELAHQAMHDPLTGLANRALLVDHLEAALHRARRHGRTVGVAFLDLDRFKVVNDSLGHAAGDELLVEVGRRIERSVRGGDLVARQGGDEFVVLLDDVGDREHAVTVVRRVLDALRAPLVVDGDEVFTTASLGLALASPHPSAGPQGDLQEIAERLLRDADAAMYRAKGQGRDRIELFDEDLREEARGRLHLETALRRAVESDEIEVFFQPEVDLTTSALVGAEALARWRHPQRGLLAAADFIELAEETGLILDVGRVVLERTCELVGGWHRERPGALRTVRVNLSARQISQPDLVDVVIAALDRGGLPASMLCLEVTETTLMADPEAGLAVLRKLRELGLTLAIDDFGTGYSSLAYLKRFPVDVVKIDRSFVDGLGQDPDDTAIVTAIVGLGRALGLRVVAEGVETTRQREELVRLGCDAAQGHLYARPQPARAFWEAVR